MRNRRCHVDFGKNYFVLSEERLVKCQIFLAPIITPAVSLQKSVEILVAGGFVCFKEGLEIFRLWTMEVHDFGMGIEIPIGFPVEGRQTNDIKFSLIKFMVSALVARSLVTKVDSI